MDVRGDPTATSFQQVGAEGGALTVSAISKTGELMCFGAWHSFIHPSILSLTGTHVLCVCVPDLLVSPSFCGLSMDTLYVNLSPHTSHTPPPSLLPPVRYEHGYSP